MSSGKHRSLLAQWTTLLGDLIEATGEHPPVSRGEVFILAALEQIMATLDEVLARVAAETSVEQSLASLLDGVVSERDALKAQVASLQSDLAASGQDTAKVQSILDALDSNDSILNASRRRLMAAVTTPASADPGPDTVSAPVPAATVSGSAGDDTVAASDSAPKVKGAPGNDSLTASAGADTVSGS